MSVEYQRRDSRQSPARKIPVEQRRRSTSRDDNVKCRRCGGIGHKAEQCEHFPYWKGKPCDCGLLHRRRDCNMSRGVHLTELDPQDRREDGQNTVPNMYIQ